VANAWIRLLLGSEGCLVELCRLFGNLCYNSDAGRSLVLSLGLLEKILAAMKSLPPGLDLPSSRLVSVVPAFLQNFCISNPGGLSAASDLALYLAGQLRECADLEQLGPFLEFLVSVDEVEGGRTLLLQKDPVCLFIVHWIALTGKAESWEQQDPDFLGLISELADNQQTASVLVAHSLNTILVDLIEENCSIRCDPEDEDKARGTKWACDLLTLLLSHVESSAVEPLLSRLCMWLDSSWPCQVSSAALILGNFCTSEASCQQLLQACPGLLEQLAGRLSSDQERPVLHAVAGCLRNLAVCRPLRSRLADVQIDQLAAQLFLSKNAHNCDFTLAFKLLGLLRLLTIENAALCCRLGAWPELLEGLAALSDTAGLQGHLTLEISRLLSCLVRYSKSADVSAAVVTRGGLPSLAALLASPHLQLQNEALVALAVLTGSRPPASRLVEQLRPDQLTLQLAEILAANSTAPEEVKWNAALVVSNILAWSLTGVTEAVGGSKTPLLSGLKALAADLAGERKLLVQSIIDTLDRLDASS
jgi:hypothetical protein